MDRWALFVDVEGFSKIYSESTMAGLLPLRGLMEGIYHIGIQVCPNTPHRLFAHQLGDAFIIVSEFRERCPELPLAIGVFLLRCVLLSGGMGSCGISQGHFGDIRSCYPDIVRSRLTDSGTVPLGSGSMHVLPVMGTALINAYRLSKREEGAILLLDSNLAHCLPSGVIVTKTTDQYNAVDWIHTATPEIAEIGVKTGIEHPQVATLEHTGREYLAKLRSDQHGPWICNTRTLNQL